MILVETTSLTRNMSVATLTPAEAWRWVIGRDQAQAQGNSNHIILMRGKFPHGFADRKIEGRTTVEQDRNRQG